MRELAGLTVLVTRPAGQAEGLCRLIEAAGGEAVRFPALAILPPGDSEAVDDALMDLPDFDLAIFISPNAVHFTLLLAQAHGGLPEGLRLAAVGRSTASALQAQGYAVELCPAERFDSEGLLALPALQDMSGQRVMIFRGEGGRETLAETLGERGAEVAYAEVYRRALPRADAGPLLARWAENRLDVVTATSAEVLRNLLVLVGETGRAALLRTPLVVVSERMVKVAGELGFEHAPVVAAGAADEAIVAALVDWRRKQGEGA